MVTIALKFDKFLVRIRYYALHESSNIRVCPQKHGREQRGSLDSMSVHHGAQTFFHEIICAVLWLRSR